MKLRPFYSRYARNMRKAIAKAKLQKNKLEIRIRGNDRLLRIQSYALSGGLAVVPIGYRYYTKPKIVDALGLSQPSMPFDNGLFLPQQLRVF